MEKKLILLPEELYFLGSLLQAKYIDYAYVAAMEDIDSNRAVYESTSRAALVNNGILTENFSGDLEVDPQALAMLKPVFFGEFEACVDISIVGSARAAGTFRFHYFEGAITMVQSTTEGKLAISSVDAEQLRSIVKDLLPVGYHLEASSQVEEIPSDKVSRIIAVKNTLIGKSAVVRLFLEADGVIYGETDSEYAQSMTAEMFENTVLDVLKEVG